MRSKIVLLGSLLFLGVCLTKLQAQNIFVRNLSDITTAYNLDSIEKISFGFGNLTVDQTNGVADVYAINTIRYLNFDGNISAAPSLEPGIETQNANVFPNPVNNVLSIQLNNTDDQVVNVEIMSIDGKVLSQKRIQNNRDINQVNVSELPNGLYLCRIIGSTTTETVKFIKD